MYAISVRQLYNSQFCLGEERERSADSRDFTPVLHSLFFTLAQASNQGTFTYVVPEMPGLSPPHPIRVMCRWTERDDDPWLHRLIQHFSRQPSCPIRTEQSTHPSGHVPRIARNTSRSGRELDQTVSIRRKRYTTTCGRECVCVKPRSCSSTWEVGCIGHAQSIKDARGYKFREWHA